MKKLITILFLLLLIGLSFSFVWLKWQASGAENNYFNSHWRSGFASSPFWRSVLGLHWDGDARSDYLGSRYDKILIEVDAMQNREMSAEALSLLAAKMSTVTGKPTSYIVSDGSLAAVEFVSDEEVAAMTRRHRGHPSRNRTATVYLLVVSRDSEKPDSLGKTIGEFGMVLFADRLAEFAAANVQTLPLYQESTALHEFGHQLGLPHNEETGCLMNESAEQAHVARERVTDVVVDFCDVEKNILIR